MAVTPVVLCLSKSGFATARRVADILGAQLHGRAGRVDGADATFDNALDYVCVRYPDCGCLCGRNFGARCCAAVGE